MRFAEQTAEQLVEVPTIISYSSLHGFVEQNVDHPVPPGRGRVDGRGLLGFNPGQSSTAFGGAEHFPASTAEQIVDIPVPRGGRDLLSAASSSGLPGSANLEIFSTFPRGRKVRSWVRTWGRNWVRTLLHPRRRLSWRVSSRMQLVCVDAVPWWWVETSGLGTRSLVAWVMAGTGPSSCVSLRIPVKVCPVLLCSRCSHLESGALFPCPCIWQSLFQALGVAYEYENWTFREMTFFVGAILGLPVDTCSASVLW